MLVLFFPHHIQLKDQFSIFFHLLFDLLFFPLEHFFVACGHLLEALLDMNQMPIYLFWSGIILETRVDMTVKSLLFDIILVDAYKMGVPFLWVDVVDDLIDIRAEISVEGFLFLGLIFDIVIFLPKSLNNFLVFFGFLLKLVLLLVLDLRFLFQVHEICFQLINQNLFRL